MKGVVGGVYLCIGDRGGTQTHVNVHVYFVYYREVTCVHVRRYMCAYVCDSIFARHVHVHVRMCE